MEFVFTKKLILFACFLLMVVPRGLAAPKGLFKDNDERKLAINEHKQGNLLRHGKDILALEPLMHDRIRRHASQYPWSRNLLLDDVVKSPYAVKRNDNRLESFYEGLRNQDDDDIGMWNYDDKAEDGIWMDSYTRPHYELVAPRRDPMALEDLLKSFKPRQSADQGYDYKNYFKY